MVEPSSCAFNGLTELVLEPLFEFYWTYSDFNRALMSCPRLRILVLIDLILSPDESDAEGPFDPLLLPTVYLRCLEVLDLRRNELNFEPTTTILPWIDTGFSTLTLSLTIKNNEPMDELFELQPFVRRSRVARFCLDMDYSRAGAFETLFPFLKDSLPLVEELALHNHGPRGYFTGLPSLRANYFPRLRTLHFIKCILDRAALQLALSSSAIQKVQVMETNSSELHWVQRISKEPEISAHVSLVLRAPPVEGYSFHQWPLSACPCG
ncbi:hypothetical protein BDV93DRAFT_206158 [Ceratobasidium sp. AG-I]|nr:hypothetical protein BDV93DRAFT_206158 [Ceratobasidium sp. AG-I]